MFKAAFRAASSGGALDQELLEGAAAEESAQAGEGPRAAIGFARGAQGRP